MNKDKANGAKGSPMVSISDAVKASSQAAGADEPSAMRESLLKAVEGNPAAQVALEPVHAVKPAPLKTPPMMNGHGPAGIRSQVGSGYQIAGPLLGADWVLLGAGRRLTEVWGYFPTRENVRLVGRFHQMPAIEPCSTDELIERYNGSVPLVSILGGIPEKFNDVRPVAAKPADGTEEKDEKPAPRGKLKKGKKPARGGSRY